MDLSSGTAIHKIDCPECQSSNNQVFEQSDGSLNSYCYGCSTFFSRLNTVNGGSYNVSKQAYNLDDIKDLPIRGFDGIHEGVCKLFNVRVALSEQDGKTIVEHFYPDTKKGELSGYEIKVVDGKKFRSLGDRKGKVDLWGTALAKRNGKKKLYITEGRKDAMSLYQIIVDNTPTKYRQYKPSVVSLTRGATSGVKDLLNNREFVEGYEEVILVLDNDKAGKKATEDILKVFHEFKVADFELKDANDMLQAGRGKELYDACVWNSEIVRQGKVTEVDDELIKEALVKPKMGLSSPWSSLDKITYGIRPHTIIILGAAPKQGKSEWKNQLIHHLAMVHNRPVGVYDLEVHPIKTLKQIASKEARINFLKPDVEYDDGLLKTTLEKFKGKLKLYDRTGSRDWVDIKISIEEQYLLDGVCEFFLDPLTALISRYSSSEANDALNEIMTDIADLVNKYPITIFAFSHVNPKPKTSKPHEAGGRILSSEFTGSRALEKWSSLGLGIERNRLDDCPEEERNISKVVILYDRDFGNYGSVDMFYNQDTTEYLEPTRRF